MFAGVFVVEEKKRERMRTIPENDKDISALYHTYPGRLLPEHLNPYKVILTLTSTLCMALADLGGAKDPLPR